ncbi:response regulator [Massilia sp. CCM 9210]|uniref:response regulator n=1 Tax=Massilia scottii TaxID=3057166 RepID=UPI0027969337|nr:response regulator [Massilia sp. CCM 9210]MDQ1812190.1 response regulator [Massilia sp. CCM 9210]
MTATSTPTKLSPPLASLHVLLVDDDPFMLELLGSMLDKLGVGRVSQATDGERGVAAIGGARGMPDVVICDIHMPGKDGFQVMEAMAASGYKGAVVLLSGMDARTLNSAALMARFHHLHVLGVMTKPVSKAALSDLLAKVTRL